MYFQAEMVYSILGKGEITNKKKKIVDIPVTEGC